jgi:hypothetical protein
MRNLNGPGDWWIVSKAWQLPWSLFMLMLDVGSGDASIVWEN